MEALNMLDTLRGEAIGMLGVGDGRVDFGGAAQDVGGKPASHVMVGRVLAAAATGRAGLLEWIEAWGTAAVIDGRCRSIDVDGAEFVVGPGRRRRVLSRIDVAVPTVEAAGGCAFDVAITVLMDDGAPVVRVVVTDDRFDCDPIIRTIRLESSIRPEPSMRLEPTSREAFSDADALESSGFARRLLTGLPTLAEVDHPWA